MLAKISLKSVGLVAAVCAATFAFAGCSPGEPQSKAGPPNIRRLTEVQYRNIIGDVFGTRISIAGSFDPLVRTAGLYSLGASSARMTPSGFEQYDRMAQSIAQQVTSPENRDVLVPCAPQDAKAADDACAKQFFGEIGRILYRHKLTDAELNAKVAEAHEAADVTHDFYSAIGSGLAGMLVSPQFLFVVDTLQTDKNGQASLTPYAKASRLSFFLWDTTPNEELLNAAEKGELETEAGVAKHVDQMIASPRLQGGVRAFFSDMLALDDFDNVEKDSIIYPSYSLAVANDAKEQTLRTIVDLTVTKRGDYRDLFTTRDTFMSGPLGRIYHVPVNRPDGGWMRYTFPQEQERAGIITLVSFTAQYAHPGRSSPTLRGKAIRESLLCQHVPDPPGDVDFSGFNDPDSPSKTARQRLEAHATNATCAGCHKVTDPIGLALERIDGAGQIRSAENGVEINPAGDLDGVKYSDAVGLGKAMHDNPAVPACAVQRAYSYAVARTLTPDDRAFTEYLGKSFAGNGYRMPELLRQIAVSKPFLSVSLDNSKKPATPEHSAEAPAGEKEKAS